MGDLETHEHRPSPNRGGQYSCSNIMALFHLPFQQMTKKEIAASLIGLNREYTMLILRFKEPLTVQFLFMSTYT
jgi:hypothetical protein